jgi:hypothetical protein
MHAEWTRRDFVKAGVAAGAAAALAGCRAADGEPERKVRVGLVGVERRLGGRKVHHDNVGKPVPGLKLPQVVGQSLDDVGGRGSFARAIP